MTKTQQPANRPRRRSAGVLSGTLGRSAVRRSMELGLQTRGRTRGPGEVRGAHKVSMFAGVERKEAGLVGHSVKSLA
jgi:hypothetical protein